MDFIEFIKIDTIISVIILDHQRLIYHTFETLILKLWASAKFHIKMATNIEEKLELLPMPAKSKEDHESNEAEKQKSASAATSVQKVEESGHEGIHDISDAISPQSSPSTSVQMPNEGIIYLHFLLQPH